MPSSGYSMRAFTVPLLIALLWAMPATAQNVVAPTVTIHGRVIDATSGQPIAAAQIEVPGTTTGTISDDDGRYTLRVPVAEDRTADLRVLSIGYRVVVLAKAQLDDDMRLDVGLVPAAVEVTACYFGPPMGMYGARASDSSPHGRPTFDRLDPSTTWSVSVAR